MSPGSCHLFHDFHGASVKLFSTTRAPCQVNVCEAGVELLYGDGSDMILAVYVDPVTRPPVLAKKQNPVTSLVALATAVPVLFTILTLAPETGVPEEFATYPIIGLGSSFSVASILFTSPISTAAELNVTPPIVQDVATCFPLCAVN
jgi:hypothetical protein